MKDYIADLIRQTEILAQVLNGVDKSKLDFAEEYEVTEITIQRDLEKLRSYGIQIFSRGKSVKLLESPLKETLIKITSDFLPLKLNSDIFKKQVTVYSNQDQNNFFPKLTLLSKAVNENLITEIKYRRFYDDKVANYTVVPIRLKADDFNWQLYAINSGEKTVKKFYLSRIEKLNLTHRKQTKIDIPEKPDNEYKVILKFIPEVENEVSDKIWFDKFELGKSESGDIILTANAILCNKLAAWCISWWDAIEILEPAELKTLIRDMIKSFEEKNY